MTAKKGSGSDKALKAELKQHGVEDPEQAKLAEDLVAAGLDRGQLLEWLATHKGDILNVIKVVVDLFGGPNQLAAMKGARETKP